MRLFGIYGGDLRFHGVAHPRPTSRVMYWVFCPRLRTKQPDPLPSRRGRILSRTDAKFPCRSLTSASSQRNEEAGTPSSTYTSAVFSPVTMNSTNGWPFWLGAGAGNVERA